MKLNLQELCLTFLFQLFWIPYYSELMRHVCYGACVSKALELISFSFHSLFMCVTSTAEADSTKIHTPTTATLLPLTWRTSFYSPTHTLHPPPCVPMCLCVCCVTFSFRKLVLPPLPPCSHSERKIWVWLLAWPLFYWACASHRLDKCPAAWEASCSSAVLYHCITHSVSSLKFLLHFAHF